MPDVKQPFFGPVLLSRRKKKSLV